MLLLKLLTTGLRSNKRRLDWGLVVAIVGLIASGAFVYSAGTRGQAALRVELADLNIRQADLKNEVEELSSALKQVATRLAAAEQDAAARQGLDTPADVPETGSLAAPRLVEMPRKGKRKGSH